MREGLGCWVRRAGVGCLGILVTVLSMAGTAQAIPLLNGFGGPAGYGANVLMTCDDCSSASIDITPAFATGLNFFGHTYNTMYVNNNGNITFAGGLSTYTPNPFPVASQPMIAPWWGDVDTRTDGRPARNGVYWYLEPNRLVVTWNLVGYFAEHDDLENDFQLILTTSSSCSSTGDFDVEFRYNQCQWTTGDASGGHGGLGGTPAQVGFDAGDLTNFVSLPMSRTMAILSVCTTSNVPGGAPGLWRFQIRGGAVATGCTGGGEPCTVPHLQGVCAMGVTQCAGMATACVQVNFPQPRRCNGFDNDCDGMVDTGSGLCPAGDVCDRGSCVPQCMPELGCLPGQTCSPQGSCIETDCLNVTCPEGQRCTGGMCVGICDGVHCPHGQSCRAGRCVDPCSGITCNSREICVAGMCVPACQCQPCAAGNVCQPDGTCVSTDCLGVSCPTGTYCQGGMCLDSCAAPPDTILCLSAEVCSLGNCIPGMNHSTGTDGGLSDGGFFTDAGNFTDTDTTNPGTDGGTVPGAMDAGPPRLILPSARGCSCRVGAPKESLGGHALAALAGMALVLGRRRQRRLRRAQKA